MRAEEINPSDPRLLAMFRRSGAKMSAGKQEVRDGFTPPSIGFPAKSGAGKSSQKGKSGAGAGSSIGVQQALRNAYNAKQAVVKITKKGRTNTMAELKAQLQYISRQGEVSLEGQGGDPVETGDNGDPEELLSEWRRDIEERGKRTSFNTYHLVVTYPEGTDDRVAEFAARDFAERLTGGDYGDQWKYALAHHRDTANPHAHLIINRYGMSGKTLHLSREAISIDQLRDLHVQTAEDYGLKLNATSRFSRGVERRPVSQAQYHAEREGRRLSPLPERSNGASEPSFPFHGAVRRQPISLDVLKKARANIARDYRALSAQFEEIATLSKAESNTEVIERLKQLAASVETKDGVAEMDGATTTEGAPAQEALKPQGRQAMMTNEQVDRLMRDLADNRKEWIKAKNQDGPNPHGKTLEKLVKDAAEESRRNPYMAEKVEDDAVIQRELKRQREREQRSKVPERGLQGAEAEHERVRQTVREIYHRTRENIDQLGSDARKTEVEKSLATIMKNYDGFLTEEDRRHFGDGIKRDVSKDASLEDMDPANQRASAKREAGGDALEKEAERRNALNETQRKAMERLDRADRTVVELFKERGLNGELALQRIKDAPDVDRQTRSEWNDRDIKAHSDKANISEKQARGEVSAAYKDASRIYAKARDDIREINHSRENTRTDQTKDRAVLSRAEERDGKRDSSISR